MDIHQSNCKMLGLTLPSRVGWFFQAVPECVYSNFWWLQILFYSDVRGKIDLQWVRCYKVVSFPYPFYLAALNLEGNCNFVVILFV